MILVLRYNCLNNHTNKNIDYTLVKLMIIVNTVYNIYHEFKIIPVNDILFNINKLK